jgi:ankyrin repeat protein
MTPLMGACLGNQLSMVEYLLSMGANINAVSAVSGTCFSMNLCCIDNIDLAHSFIGREVSSSDDHH